jgi:hypothetical protein
VRRRLPQLLLAATLALSVLGAGSAAADPGLQVTKRSLRSVLLAKAGHGYSLWVETNGHRQVKLTMSKGSVGAVYTTTGKVSRRGIEADFGELGEISVRFQGKLLRPRHPQRASNCRGRRPQMASGDFRGTIRFEGENGYSSIDVAEARGLVLRKYRRVCRSSRLPQPQPKPHKRGGRGGKKDDPVDGRAKKMRMNLLTVGGEAGGRAVFMRALEFENAPWLVELLFGTLLVGGTLEHREGVRIERVTVASGGSNALQVSRGDGEPTRVDVLFPKPLRGKAELIQAEGSPPSWTGSLSMPLPGAGSVPLTGPGLAAVYCRLSLTDAEESPCLLRADELLPGDVLSGSPRLRKLLVPQESGSHSQALADVRLSWSRYWRNSASSSGFTE